MKQEPLLHQAVLDNNIDLLKKFKNDPAYFLETNELGFTAFELAELLGKWECLMILDPKKDLGFKVQWAETEPPKTISEKEWLRKFDFSLLTTLFFDSYARLKKTIREKSITFSYLALGEESRSLGKRYQEAIFEGFKAPIFVKKLKHEKGFGLFAETDIQDSFCLGEYAGRILEIPLFSKRAPLTDYCFEYESAFFSLHQRVIDASKEGSLLRFANHSDSPSCETRLSFDRGLLHVLVFTKRKLLKEEEITLDYGEDFWIHRKKWPDLV